MSPDLLQPEKNETNGEQLNNLSAEPNRTNDFFSFVLDLLKTGVVVFVLAFLLRYFAIQPYIVDGESMMPNFVNREYLLAEKVTYWFHQPDRGDVIVFQYPKNPSVNYIKRIIGVPGDTVKIEDNKVTVTNTAHPDGLLLNETYIPKDSQTEPFFSTKMETTLKDNEFFVLGDNREHSSDSREWGILPKANIRGRAWLTLVPLSRFGLHEHVTFQGLSLIFSRAFAQGQ